MKPPLSWPLVSPLPRIEALGRLKDLANRWGALVDYQAYSDTAAMLRVELAGPKVPGFWDELAATYRLVVPRPQLTDVEEVTVLLAVTFPDGTGDLSHLVPSVPG